MTQVLFASTPAHPHPGRCWDVIQKYKVRRQGGGSQLPGATHQRCFFSKLMATGAILHIQYVTCSL